MSIKNFIRPDLISTNAYEPPYDNLSQRMHMNELPWSRLNLVSTPLNYYPDPEGELRLQRTLADLYQVEEDQVLVTRGSDEGIDFLMRLFLRPGIDSILQCPPTFSMYAFFAKLQQGEVINCLLDESNGFEICCEAIKSQWQPQCKLIMLCRPNNPTGNILDLSLVSDLCQTYQGRSVIVVDEAYIEFSDQLSASCLINQYDNVIVLRTLSKAYGLAGLRIGSILAQSTLIQSLRNIVPPYRFSNVVTELAIEALSDTAWFKQKIECICSERSKLTRQLKNCPWVERVYSSQANFLFIKSPQALMLKQWILEQGIAVRHFPTPQLQSFLRIAVGDKQLNALLLESLTSWSGS